MSRRGRSAGCADSEGPSRCERRSFEGHRIATMTGSAAASAATGAAPPRSVRSTRTRSSGPSGSTRSSGSGRVAERLAISLEAAQEAGRAAAAHPLRRPARAGQDDLRHRPAQRAGRRAEHHQRRRARQEDGRDALPDQRRRGLDPVHRRDPPAAQHGRGVHLSGHGGLPGRRRAGRGDVGPDDQPAAEEVHDHRRHDPQRHALRPAPRAVRHPRAPGILRRRGPGADHHDQRRQAPLDDRRPRRPGSWRRGAAGRRGSPMPGSGGSATTRWPAPTGTSTCPSPAMRSTCRRWTPRGSTSRTAATWRP